MNDNPIFKQQSALDFDVFKQFCNEAKIGSDGDSLNKKKCLEIYRRMDSVYPGMAPWTFACFFASLQNCVLVS
jgi:hypothetical protein